MSEVLQKVATTNLNNITVSRKINDNMINVKNIHGRNFNALKVVVCICFMCYNIVVSDKDNMNLDMFRDVVLRVLYTAI